jgi:hypothetical protein
MQQRRISLENNINPFLAKDKDNINFLNRLPSYNTQIRRIALKSSSTKFFPKKSEPIEFFEMEKYSIYTLGADSDSESSISSETMTPLPSPTKMSPLKNAEDYNLIQGRSDEYRFSPSNVTHLYLPQKHKNDENYKRKLISFLREPGNSDYKTTNKPRKLSQLYDGNLTKFYSILNMKQRKVSSMKKVFESIRYFEGAGKYEEKQFFKIYADKCIGLGVQWQKQLKETVNYF